MAAEYRVALFLEDLAQEAFILPLCERLMVEEGYHIGQIEFVPLHARGGDPIGSLKRFLKDARKDPSRKMDLLIVGRDANCKGFIKRRDEILRLAQRFRWTTVIAVIPDPHIERWFMIDMNALRRASGVQLAGGVQRYKCDKERYKRLLRDAFQGSGVVPPMGGLEYGARVVEYIDLYEACKLDTGLNTFVSEFRNWLRQMQRPDN